MVHNEDQYHILFDRENEWAHSKMYRSYLNAAHQVDAWLQQLWNYVQSRPAYK
ncbi:MAG TPA: hypothetical protein PLR74_06190 [Agriterribacter sp.]|nr:hypothetical protein [Agriterribacter sp.]